VTVTATLRAGGHRPAHVRARRPPARGGWQLAAVLVAYAGLALLFSWRTPAWENNDEADHVTYVEHVAATGSPPPISLAYGVEAAQAPLYYYLAAGWQKALGIPAFTPDDRPAAHPVEWRGARLYYLSHDYDAAERQQALWVHEIRLLSIVLGAGGVACAYAAVRLLTRRAGPAVAVAATVGFWPKYLVVTAAVTNSALAFALCSAALACLAGWWTRRSGWRPVAYGAVAGLAVLADVTTLPVVGAGLALGVGASLWRKRWRQAAASVAAFAAVAGWWFVDNTVTYGDPLREAVTTRFLRPFAGGALIRNPPQLSLSILDTYSRVLVHSVFYDGGWNQLHLPGAWDWALTAAGLACVAAALATRTTGWPLYAGFAAGSVVVWLVLVRATTQGEGRYLLVAVAAWAALLVSGALRAGRGHPLAGWAWPAAFLAVDGWLIATLLVPYGRL